MSTQVTTANAPRRSPGCRVRGSGLGRFGVTGTSVWLVALAIMVAVAPPVSAQSSRSVVDYPSVPPEQLADVILVLKPHADHALHIMSPTERAVQGDIVRIERGGVPPLIVHTPHTMIAPLRAGEPVKLFLKQHRGRNAYYIIGIFPEWYGGQP